MSSFPLATREPNTRLIEPTPGPGHYVIPSTLRSGTPAVIHGHDVTSTKVSQILDDDKKKLLTTALRGKTGRSATETLSDDELSRSVWAYTQAKAQTNNADESFSQLPPPPPRNLTRGRKSSSGKVHPRFTGSARGAWLWMKPGESPGVTLTTARTIQPEPGAYKLKFDQVEERLPTTKIGREPRFLGNDKVSSEGPGPKYALPAPEVESHHVTAPRHDFGFHFEDDKAKAVAASRHARMHSLVGPGSYDVSQKWGVTDQGVPRAVIGPPALSAHAPGAIKRTHTQGQRGGFSPGPCYNPPQETIAYGVARAEATDKLAATVGTSTVSLPRAQTARLPKNITATAKYTGPMRGLPPTVGKLDRVSWLKTRNVRAKPIASGSSMANDVKREVVVESCSPGPIYDIPSDFKVSLREVGQMRVACRLRNVQMRVKAQHDEAGRRDRMKEEIEKKKRIQLVERLRKEDVEFRSFADIG